MYYYNQPTSQYWAIHQPLATVRVRPVGLQEIIHMHPQAFYSVVVEVLRIINLTPIKDSEIVRLDKVCPCLSISVKMQDYNSLLYVLVSSRTATLQRYQPLLCPLWVKPQSLPPSLSSTSLSLSLSPIHLFLFLLPLHLYHCKIVHYYWLPLLSTVQVTFTSFQSTNRSPFLLRWIPFDKQPPGATTTRYILLPLRAT